MTEQEITILEEHRHRYECWVSGRSVGPEPEDIGALFTIIDRLDMELTASKGATRAIAEHFREKIKRLTAEIERLKADRDRLMALDDIWLGGRDSCYRMTWQEFDERTRGCVGLREAVDLVATAD